MSTVSVLINPRSGALGDITLSPERNCITGNKEFSRYYGSPTSLEADLLRLASAIYCSDLAVKRGERELFVRDIELHVPVGNHHVFARVREDIETTLCLLSGDNWSLKFHRTEDSPEVQFPWQEKPGEALLFSGGLDSLAGAHDRLNQGVEHLTLVSHVTSNNVVRGSQEDLFERLTCKFGDRLSRRHFFVSGRNKDDLPFPQDSDREETQRTRSFMFLTLGALVARRQGYSRVLLIAENGQMAIHLPLTAARVGAFSTRTAHPSFLFEMQGLLSTVLDFPLKIHNPYLYCTKAEVVQGLVSSAPDLIQLSGSCWRASRIGAGYKHCGECIPCLIRRIALEHHGLVLSEYKRDLLAEDVLALPQGDIGKRNLSDLLEFAVHFHKPQLRQSATEAFPELVDGTFDTGRAIEMYTRFAEEAVSVLSRYPGVQGLLS